MNKYLLPGATLLSLVSGGASAAPTPIGTFNEQASAACPSPPSSVWPSSPPNGDVGGLINGTAPPACGPIAFTAPFAGTLVMTVQQSTTFGAGHVFQAFVDGNSVGTTSIVPVSVTGTDFTSGTFTAEIPAGPNTFDINDQLLAYIGAQAPYGPPSTTVPASFSPVGIQVTLAEELPSAVPEPRSLWVMFAGLCSLGWLLARRKTA
ncbi:MAG TPA: PEP-CTERM sorting domain-containing protein [Stellaceae bacterium]|nr:PEP-CTERM sorting domain-containing protein [Stellaceae bacterium]